MMKNWRSKNGKAIDLVEFIHECIEEALEERVKMEFTTQEKFACKNLADLEEGIFQADYIIYTFESGEGVAYGEEGYIEFFLTADEIDRIARHSDTVGAGDIFQAAWDFYDVRGWK